MDGSFDVHTQINLVTLVKGMVGWLSLLAISAVGDVDGNSSHNPEQKQNAR